MLETENYSSKNKDLEFFFQMLFFSYFLTLFSSIPFFEISRLDKPGTEARFTLPGTDKKLRPLRCALSLYLCVMLRISTVGNTLNVHEE